MKIAGKGLLLKDTQAQTGWAPVAAGPERMSNAGLTRIRHGVWDTFPRTKERTTKVLKFVKAVAQTHVRTSTHK